LDPYPVTTSSTEGFLLIRSEARFASVRKGRSMSLPKLHEPKKTAQSIDGKKAKTGISGQPARPMRCRIGTCTKYID
jgi:hypothetical protein